MTIRLTRKLVLQEKSKTQDGAGGFDSVWADLGTHWAHIEARTSRFESGDGYPRSRVPYRITLRAVPMDSVSRPASGQRFREGERIYKIRSVADLNTDARYLVCLADEEVAA